VFKADAIEAQPIVDTVLAALLALVPTRGRDGASLRAKVSQVRANALTWLQADTIGEPLAECFDISVDLGITFQQAERVRQIATAYAALLPGAIMVRDSLVRLALIVQGRTIAVTEFKSRTDVENIRALVNKSFGEASEAAANSMDAMTYRAIVSLQAAISFFLVETARPLPRMLNYQFGQPMSTIAIAHRLYADASRFDEIRTENRTIHPLFAQRFGRALSA
jgi:prophage DNA circulation protein